MDAAFLRDCLRVVRSTPCDDDLLVLSRLESVLLEFRLDLLWVEFSFDKVTDRAALAWLFYSVQKQFARKRLGRQLGVRPRNGYAALNMIPAQFPRRCCIDREEV